MNKTDNYLDKHRDQGYNNSMCSHINIDPEKDIETIEIAKVISEIFLISLNPMERQENL